MIQTLLATKKGMTSTYDSRGRRVGATIVTLAPNVVTQIKSKEIDGYTAVQIGIATKKSVKKPQQGHLKKAGASESTRFLREVRVSSTEDVTLGQSISTGEVLHTGDLVKVQGVSKGKGFQGTVRRHGFHGGPKTHGQSDRHRAPGSIGQGTTPGRVYKGKKMSGHMGVDTVSVKGLEVIKIDKVTDEVVIKGGVPGPIGGLLHITWQGQVKGYVAPVEEELSDQNLELSSEQEDTSEIQMEAQTADEVTANDTTENTPDTQETSEQTQDETPEDTQVETVEQETNEEAAIDEAPVEETSAEEEAK